MRSVTLPAGARRQAGFSMIELMIAMVVTLLVTGAMFGLMTAGQSAFRREPQLTDRQQSIRQAMAAIEEDVQRAGLGLPASVQVFTDGLDGAGGPGVIAANQRTDHLEMVTGDPNCGVADVCDRRPAVQPSGGALGGASVPRVPACVAAGLPSLLAFFDANGSYVIQPTAAGANVAVVGCGGVAGGPGSNQLNRTMVRFTGTPAVPLGPFPATGYTPVQFVRYEVADCGPGDLAGDGTPMPCLWRSTTGRFDLAGNNVGPAPGAPAGNGVWQIVARGIDDLQVRYRNGLNFAPAAAATNTPGAIVCTSTCTTLPELNMIVRRVEVTLSARVAARDLPGETRSVPGAPLSVRGQLTGVFTPRAALAALTRATPSPLPVWQ